MGLFDFFVEVPPLEERFKNALSSHFHGHKSILKRLAREQSKLSQQLGSEEEILLITHSEFDTFDRNFGIITNKRVFLSIFDKGKLYKQLPHSEIADIRRYVNGVNGNFSIELIGSEALPYAGIPFTQMGGRVSDIWLKNTINIYAPQKVIIDEFETILRLAKQQ